jgi:hypothetical protein
MDRLAQYRFARAAVLGKSLLKETATATASDFAKVMDSRGYLRQWSPVPSMRPPHKLAVFHLFRAVQKMQGETTEDGGADVDPGIHPVFQAYLRNEPFVKEFKRLVVNPYARDYPNDNAWLVGTLADDVWTKPHDVREQYLSSGWRF